MQAQSPILVSPQGKYLGNLNDNPYDPNSVANPYGKYGSEYSLDSVNNPYGRYGSEYSLESPNNPVATSAAPRVYGSDGRYLGRLSKNPYDLESTSNPDGKYGSEYSLDSINNPSGPYGSEYSTKSATYLYGRGFNDKEGSENITDLPRYLTEIVPPSPQLLNARGEEYLTLLQQRTTQLQEQIHALVLDKVKRNAQLKHQIQEKERLNAFLIEADKIVDRHKQKLIELYREGRLTEIKLYFVMLDDFEGIPENAKPVAEQYVEERLEKIKKILLKQT